MNELFEILTLRYRWLFAALLLSISACSPTLPTNIPVEVTFENPAAERVGGVRLAPPEPSWDGYGEAVDIHGDVLVVGAPEWNPCGHGSAYVYRSSGGEWREETQLTASDRDDVTNHGRRYGLRFGTAVAAGEDVIAIGATGNAFSGEGEYPGAVYLYEYDGRVWTETAKLSPDPLSGEVVPSVLTPAHCTRMRPELFGALVALDGDTLAVGGDARGFVYLYQRGNRGWQEEARVAIPGVPGRETHTAFMALFGDTLAVSIFYIDPHSTESLSPTLTGNAVVYLFERAGEEWQESLRFAPEGEEDIVLYREVNIGASVALSGASEQANLLAVGLPGFPDWSEVENNPFFGANSEQAPAFPPSHRQTGAVYLFERSRGDGWRQQAILRPAGWEDPPGPPNTFPFQPLEELSEAEQAAFYASFVFPGHIFSESPEVSFFGATVDLDENRLAATAGFSNATYVFERRGQAWHYQFHMTARQQKIEAWEDWAQVVSISGDTLLLGTPSEFGNSAYVFSLATDANDG